MEEAIADQVTFMWKGMSENFKPSIYYWALVALNKFSQEHLSIVPCHEKFRARVQKTVAGDALTKCPQTPVAG